MERSSKCAISSDFWAMHLKSIDSLWFKDRSNVLLILTSLYCFAYLGQTFIVSFLNIMHKKVSFLNKVGITIIALCFLSFAGRVSSIYRMYGVMIRYHGVRDQSFLQTTWTVIGYQKWHTPITKNIQLPSYYTILELRYIYQWEIINSPMSLYDHSDEKTLPIKEESNIPQLWEQISLLVYPLDPTTLIPSYDAVILDYWMRLLVWLLFWAILTIPFGFWGFSILFKLVKD